MDDDDFVLIEREPASAGADENGQTFWKLLIVDDDPSVHAATRFALSNRNLLGRPFEFMHAYSAAEALERLAKTPDVALILLDVVMESPHAGLEMVRAIREELGNSEVRIILRTGQPGYAPEEEVVQALDINDYKLKTELPHPKLLTCIAGALRAYRQIHELAESRRETERQKRHLQQAQQLAGVGSWHLDLIRQTIDWSDEALRMLGYSTETRPDLPDSLLAVHPNDHSALRSHREALPELDEYHIEFSTTGAIPDRRYIEHARLIRDAHGRPVAAVAAIHDITEIRKQESHLRILAAAAEQNPLPMAVIDAESAIHHVNGAFAARFKVPPGASLHGMEMEKLLDPDDLSVFALALAGAAQGQQWHGQLRWQNDHGSTTTSQVTITPIRDAEGTHRHFLMQHTP